MDKIQRLRDFEIGFGKPSTLFSALVACLNAIEACEIFDLSFEQDTSKRQAILKKIGSDIQAEFQDCHNTLIRELVTTYEELPYSKKLACAASLGYLSNDAPKNIQDQIIRLLAASRYVRIRRIGYKNLDTSWTDGFQWLVENNWQTYQDPECVHLMIDHFAIESLEADSLNLRDKVKGTRYLQRLYLRIADIKPERLEELKQVDEITYLYVAVKLMKNLGDQEALEIFEHNKNDERIGLMIWCFGQMKLCSVLEKITDEIDRLMEQK
jgi:hypothetical protein